MVKFEIQTSNWFKSKYACGVLIFVCSSGNKMMYHVLILLLLPYSDRSRCIRFMTYQHIATIPKNHLLFCYIKKVMNWNLYYLLLIFLYVTSIRILLNFLLYMYVYVWFYFRQNNYPCYPNQCSGYERCVDIKEVNITAWVRENYTLNNKKNRELLSSSIC